MNHPLEKCWEARTHLWWKKWMKLWNWKTVYEWALFQMEILKGRAAKPTLMSNCTFGLCCTPLTDGGEMASWHLAHQLLSVWHWSSVRNPPVYLSSTFKIKHWLLDLGRLRSWRASKWVEAYACTLQWLVVASLGWSWTTEGQTMTPKVTKLVETFMAVMEMWVSPCRIWEWWPMVPDKIPQQNLDGVRTTIVKFLDEVASHQLSLTAWDMFAFPKEDKEHWWEDCLLYYPWKVVNIRARMPGKWLDMQDTKGQYSDTEETDSEEWNP